jgi:hypothetical protein
MMVACEGPRHIVARMLKVAAYLWDKTVGNLTKAWSWGIVTKIG